MFGVFPHLNIDKNYCNIFACAICFFFILSNFSRFSAPQCANLITDHASAHGYNPRNVDR